MDKFLNWFIALAISAFVAFPVAGLVMADYYAKHSEPEPKIVILKENSLGCKKLFFKNDVFWTCPKNVVGE